jgi:hypothetical protein
VFSRPENGVAATAGRKSFCKIGKRLASDGHIAILQKQGWLVINMSFYSALIYPYHQRH